MDQLRKDGWHINESQTADYFDKGVLPKTSPEILKVILNEDLRNFGEASIINLHKKDESIFEGPCVLQLLRYRNVSVPRIKEELNQTDPSHSIIRLFLTDGHTSLSALVLQTIPGINSDTPPGTKIQINGKIEMEGGNFLILEKKHVKILGGRVEEMIEKWNVEKSSVRADGFKSSVGKGTGAPKWVSFGKRGQKGAQLEKGFKVVESLVKSLENAKHSVKRGRESKAIDRAVGILRTLDDEPNPVNEINEDDDSPDVMDQDLSDKEVVPYSKKTWERIFNLRFQKKHSLATIIHSYKLLKTPQIAKVYIARKLKEFQSSSKKLSKSDLLALDRNTWKVILAMDENYETIHDYTIREVALREAKRMGKVFKASETWVLHFKKKHHLKSRHIDTFVTNKKLESREELKKTMKAFREDTWPMLRKKHSEKKIWNADQTGLKLESVGLRTITVKGKKKIYRRIQRSSAVTHSLTLHIAISAAGKLFKKTYLVLHEKKLPRKFEKIRNAFEYLKITNTQSGMMNSAKSIDWMKNTFLPSIPKNSALLLDSWTGFDKMEKLPDVKKKCLQIEILPPGTTAELQPLDVFFNRQLKAFNKRMNEKIKIYHSKYSISKRENMLSLINFMISQFAAPMFQPMIQLAWYKAGFIKTHPPPFITPSTYCFSIPQDKLVCDSSNCFKDTFLVCAHCSDSICFSHVLNHVH
ncbi:unnamed protein product [Caenorhabditis nigoni]